MKLASWDNKWKLLIDGDILVYRMGFASQSEDSENCVSHCTYLVKKLLRTLMEKFKTTDIKVYLTADNKSNFRFKLAKTKPYKGNRDKKINPNAVGRPEYYSEIRKYLVDTWNAEVVQDIEADDALSIAQMEGENRTIIVSLDKDLNMVPGFHYNFVTDTLYESQDPGELVLKAGRKKIEGTGYKWFYAQMLLGDPSDNIPGLKGYGPVKVFNLLSSLDTEEELWEAVVDQYKQLECDSRLYEIADLLWMQRSVGDTKSLFLNTLAVESGRT